MRKYVASLFVCLAPLFAVTTLHAESTNSFRVMTYNIHHAEGLDGKIDLERIANLIKEERADIVALQEVDRGMERTSKRDLPAEFAKLTGMSCVFSNNWSIKGGEYGVAILTRFPIIKREHSLLKRVGTNEQRGLLQTHLQIGDREVVFMNTHINHSKSDEERLLSVAEFAPTIKKKSDLPIFFCGDFNATPDSHVYKNMNALLDDTWKLIGKGDGPTIPAEKPNRRIDYIWISKDGSIIPLNAHVPNVLYSDHLPLVAEFKLK